MSAATPSESPGPAQAASDAIDLHSYWRTIVARRWVVVPFFVFVVLATALVTLRSTKIYDATCTIIIDLSAPRVLEKEQVQDVLEAGPGGYWYTREYYETQYRVITSRAVAQRVSDKLQLGSHPRFLALLGGGERDAKLDGPDPIATLLKHLKVEPVKESRIVKIRFEHPDPEIAAMVANATAEAYIAETLAVRSTTTASASDWLERQLEDLERKLDSSAKALFDFKREKDIVATSWEDRQSMVSQRLTTINDALTRARVRKAELQGRDEAIQALGSSLEGNWREVESLPPVATSQAIQGLKVRYLEVRSECEALVLRYLEGHPLLQACETRLAVARKGLEDQIQTALDAARNEYQEVTKTEHHLVALLNEAKSDAFGLNQHERSYLELKRAYDNNQRLYELVLKRLKDTGVTGLLQFSNVRILDRARPADEPIRPSAARNLALALVIGLVGGVLLGFAADRLDASVATQEHVEEQLGLAFLGIVPSIGRTDEAQTQDLVVHTHPKSAVAECLRAIRTNLLFMSPEKPLRTILVTSSGPQEGKTTTAISLAITMAHSGNRVLLVDADMRRPRVHRTFGVGGAVGLSSLVVGSGRLEDAVVETDIPNLSVLPCGPVPPNPAELLHTAAFRRIIEESAARFDRVVVDSPPAGVVADAAILATHVDGTVFVVKTGKTMREVARQGIRQLRDVNARILGAVLNDLDLQNQRYGKYYYQYGRYYEQREGAQAPAEVG